VTWTNRFRLIGGILAVIIVVAAASLLLNLRESQVISHTGNIKAETYKVATEYPGTIVAKPAVEGATVVRGDALLVVQSVQLARAIELGSEIPVSPAYTVGEGGQLTLLATEPGIISIVDTQLGGWVDAGVPLVYVDTADSLSVIAEYWMDPFDFGRVEIGAFVEIILPDHTRINGRVESLRVETTDGIANARVVVRSDDLVRGEHGGLVIPGTPVTVILHLRDDGPLSGISDSIATFFEQAGI
jgi:multidrug resistance efflux pump